MADAWFSAPLLRVLDARGRADVRAAASVRRLLPGAVAFAPGDAADSLWFVGEGSVLVSGARGSRRVGPSEQFGTEALVRGGVRAGRATATDESVLLEVQASALRRVLGRAGAESALAREEAAARRLAFASLLGETPLGQGLDERALHALAGELHEERRARGEALFVAGAPADAAWLVANGLVRVGDSARSVYAARGDWLGLSAALARKGHGEGATALGDVLALKLPRAALSALSERDRAALARQESHDGARLVKQRRVQELAEERATRHAFHELERLESARSLLAIDLESCVRCGQCVVACGDAHGTPRLERRGERAVLTAADASGAFGTRALLFPHACHHCKDPVCLPECPTGAIGRDASGAVLLREDLCTGCGACAKACPWDGIRMAPRSSTAEPGASALVASKCDLCRGSHGPECVSACPTGAIFRADPERELVELRGALGHARPAETRPAVRRESAPVLRVVWLVALVPPLVALARVSAVASRFRFETGVLAGLVLIALGLHAGVKRFRLVRSWLSQHVTPRLGRRGLSSLVLGHVGAGSVAGVLVLAHTGGRLPAGALGALALVFWLSFCSGAVGALAYRWLPARLARLERRGTLPEDHPAELDELNQRLFAALSAQNPALKELARRVLVPYARSLAGPLLLALSGRTLAEEEARLATRVARLLGGRRSERLAEAGGLVKTAVALRALATRRWLERGLGAWLPAHLVLAVLLFALLGIHVLAVLR